MTGAKTVLNMEQTCVGQGKGVCSAHRVTDLRIFLLVWFVGSDSYLLLRVTLAL